MAKHLKRPRDPNQLAKLIVDMATGEVEETRTSPDDDRNPGAAHRKGDSVKLI